MKKILASVLAAASMLTMSATAFATETTVNDPTKNITKGDEFSYEVNATSPKVVFDVLMPAKLTAWLNPYNANMKIVLKKDKDDAYDSPAPLLTAISADTTSSASVGSVAYRVINRSTEYAVSIDAKATTTVNTADEKPWAVKGNSVTAGTKGAAVQLIFAGAESELVKGASGAEPTLTSGSAKKGSATAGRLELNSEAKENTKLGLEAGQVEQKAWGWLGKATVDSADEPTKFTVVGQGYIQFVGLLAKSDETAGAEKPVNWTADDSININVIFKLNVGKDSLT